MFSVGRARSGLSDNAPAPYLCDFLFALYACLQLREGRCQTKHESADHDWSRRHCQSKFVYFATTSEPDFVAIDFPAFFRVDLSGSMAAPSI